MATRASSPRIYTGTTAGQPQGEVQLGRGALWRTTANGHKPAVRCLKGMVWITQEGDSHDHLLRAGEAFLATHHGTVLVQALREASIRVDR